MHLLSSHLVGAVMSTCCFHLPTEWLSLKQLLKRFKPVRGTVLPDDSLARKCARSYAIPIKGTLAIVLMAKHHGLIESASEVVHSLRRVGFHLDDRMVREVLAQAANEEWNP